MNHMPIFLPKPIYRFIERIEANSVSSADVGDFLVFEQRDGSRVGIHLDAYVMYARQRLMGRCG